MLGARNTLLCAAFILVHAQATGKPQSAQEGPDNIRLDLCRTLEKLGRLFEIPLSKAGPSVEIVRLKQIRIERGRLFELCHCLSELFAQREG